MLLKHRTTGHLMAVANLEDLVSAYHDEVLARDQVGEEEQDPEPVSKGELVFMSGEELPRCWTDPHYRDEALRH